MFLLFYLFIIIYFDILNIYYYYFIIKKKKMKKIFYLIFLFYFTLCLNSTNKTENEKIKTSGDNLLSKKVKEYLIKNDLSSSSKLNLDEFIKMFIEVVSEDKNKPKQIFIEVAKKIVKNHGEPILIKNINNYFNLEEMTLLYSEILEENKQTDL